MYILVLNRYSKNNISRSTRRLGTVLAFVEVLYVVNGSDWLDMNVPTQLYDACQQVLVTPIARQTRVDRTNLSLTHVTICAPFWFVYA